MNDQAIRFRLGIFVLASLILLAVLITLFGGFPTYFKRADTYTVVFNNATGIAPGSPVRRSGVRIGEVRAVRLDDETGQVEVQIQIEEGHTVRKGDRPTIIQSLLGGDAAIALLTPEDLAPPAKEPAPPGAVLQGAAQPDAKALVQKTGELMPVAQDTMVEAKKLFERLDKLTPLLEDALKEFRDVGKAANQLVPELRKTNLEVLDLIKTTRATVPDLKRTNEEIQLTVRQWGKVGERVDLLIQSNEDKVAKALDRLQDTLKRVSDILSDENQRNIRDILRNAKAGSDHFEGIAKNTDTLLKDTNVAVKRLSDTLLKADSVLTDVQKATKPLAERSPVILKNIEETTDKLNRTLTDLRDVFQAVARGDGTLQKLLTDPALYNNINDSAAMVTKILPRVDRILRDMEVFADKLARHPELIGVGGAIRPSSGLKDNSVIMPWKH